jgi:hypothetical protein
MTPFLMVRGQENEEGASDLMTCVQNKMDMAMAMAVAVAMAMAMAMAMAVAIPCLLTSKSVDEIQGIIHACGEGNTRE